MINSHPITPPPELVQQWWKSAPGDGDWLRSLATQAARWGADMELEVCCEWLDSKGSPNASRLRATRRPKPPTLKEQALAVITNSAICDHLRPQDEAILRRALEALDD